MHRSGVVAPAGQLSLQVIRSNGQRHYPHSLSVVPAKELSVAEILEFGTPQRGLSEEVNRWRRANFRHLWRGARKVLAARALHVSHFYGQLSLAVIRNDGRVVDLGLASMRVVTNAGVDEICTRMANVTPANIANFNFHGLGTGTNAEATADTALQTELTTQYQTDNTRPTGTQSNPAGTATTGVYRTVGTIQVDASVAATEHGVLTQAATGGGTLLDRSVFTVVNLASGESIQATYDFTITAGS